MKIFKTFILLVLILVFNNKSFVKANDVTEFTIEGVSIGESLLEYISEEEIKAKINSKATIYYPNNAFSSIPFKNTGLDDFDSLGVVIKPGDNTYKIYAIEGTLYFGKKINKCYEKQIEISSFLENFFGKDASIERFDADYIADKSGDSKVRYVDFLFKDGSASRVICYDLSSRLNESNPDQLYLVVNSKDFMEFINENM